MPRLETRLIVRISVERIGGVAPGYKAWNVITAAAHVG